ncbi:MAG TPA: hydroxymethylglutaryl-CoA lyase [Cyclobacteriaceae bacterium]|nr:hydroxymethylglutaryl-CoA lyase [Cyclobacteriaceae bacterium]HRJ82485.1 hydroxymethylglutaryl-CoA lyase [Cyclobacteriaceae bacterium]
MKIIECPRDAMQGLTEFIPTEKKIRYINQLLEVGFDTIDFGSFVSPKAIPQLRDTVEVLGELNWEASPSKLLAIVANTRGAEEACKHEAITYLGFPLSISETFQQRNTNKSIAEALNTVAEIQELCQQSGKKLVCYISMGFGNPYGDPYDVKTVEQFVDILVTLGIEIISLADTIGVSNPENITFLFTSLAKKFPAVELGAHLHSNPKSAAEKVEAAFNAGCKRFDGAIKGFGGCPMAKDDLVGNLATETILECLGSYGAAPDLNQEAFQKSLLLADEIFPKH